MCNYNSFLGKERVYFYTEIYCGIFSFTLGIFRSDVMILTVEFLILTQV